MECDSIFDPGRETGSEANVSNVSKGGIYALPLWLRLNLIYLLTYLTGMILATIKLGIYY